MTDKHDNPDSVVCEMGGLEAEITRSELNGKLVVSIMGPGDEDCNKLGSPDIRVWLNDALIYSDGETGDDLPWPKGSENHREIDCPSCEGPVCDLDGNGPEMVFTLTYTHKHGADVGVYKTREGALAAAYGLAFERSEEWDDEEATARFKAEEDKVEALCIFDDVEANWAYSEILEISETELMS
jgi:hypothetical protein